MYVMSFNLQHNLTEYVVVPPILLERKLREVPLPKFMSLVGGKLEFGELTPALE